MYRDFGDYNFWHLPEYQVINRKQFDDFITQFFDDDIRVYYLDKYIRFIDMSKYLVYVPLVAINGDGYVRLRGNDIPFVDGLEITNYKQRSDLITYDERIKARRKVILSNNLLFGYGGYKSEQVAYKKPVKCIILTYAAPQLENLNLEYQLFISKNNIPKSIRLNNGAYFDMIKYTQTIREDVSLILHAIEDYCSDKHSAYVHVVAAGTGFFANVPNVGNIGHLLMPIILESYLIVLRNNRFENIGVLCLLDFTSNNQFSYTGKINNVNIITEKNRDVADFNYVKSNYSFVAINPGDAFSSIGNEAPNASVEAALGNCSTLRITQNFFYNPSIFDNAIGI